MGVPGPTLVSSSLASLLSIVVAPPRYEGFEEVSHALYRNGGDGGDPRVRRSGVGIGGSRQGLRRECTRRMTGHAHSVQLDRSTKITGECNGVGFESVQQKDDVSRPVSSVLVSVV